MYFVSYLFVRSATGIDIPRSVKIGPGLMIHHFGGVIIHPQAELGADCTLRHGVTIGVRKDDDHPPVIGDRVTFGAYAQVLGDVTIGDDVLIGSLTLVLNDIPSNSTVVGIPGKVVSTDSDEASS
ncbi:serine O-acetyltransferase [Agreia bicolorata]|nr:hypothetical protein [Agreia bicolorata]